MNRIDFPEAAAKLSEWKRSGGGIAFVTGSPISITAGTGRLSIVSDERIAFEVVRLKFCFPTSEGDAAVLTSIEPTEPEVIWHSSVFEGPSHLQEKMAVSFDEAITFTLPEGQMVSLYKVASLDVH